MSASAKIELPIEGMTCASCANRIERRLNKLEGVEATVNYATEQASVSFDAQRVPAERLLEAVEAAGYRAKLPSVEAGPGTPGPASVDTEGMHGVSGPARARAESRR